MADFVCGNETEVQIADGRMRGFRLDGIYSFRGVPYAKATRFHMPEQPDAFTGVFDATNFGCVCPLLDMPKPNGELYVPHRYWVMDEDCLNLNIWTPGIDDKKRPVMVWLHGGGYEAGSAIEQTIYDGDRMAKYGDCVVVTVNHRLNILGYLDLSEFGEEYEHTGNLGMFDIIAALRWIRENIASFGGDPEMVTLFGQSGGGGKIKALLQMPAADGLFKRAINMSGVLEASRADEVGSARELICGMMKEAGVEDVHGLEKLSYAALVKAYKAVRPALEREGKYVGGKPHPNADYRGDSGNFGMRPESGNVDMLVGSVSAELFSFAGFLPDETGLTEEEQKQKIAEIFCDEEIDEVVEEFRKAYPERPIIDLLKLDQLIRVPVLEFVHKRCAFDNKTYLYLFNQDFFVNGRKMPWHCSDIAYFFHNADKPEYTHGIDSDALEEQIFRSVMAFARTGDPSNPTVPVWKPCTEDEKYTMIFDENTRLCKDHDRKLLALMEKYMDIYWKLFENKASETLQH